MSGERPQRVRPAQLDWLLDSLSERDWQIVREVNRARLLTSFQLERLCFAERAGRSRSVIRSRVLKRLCDWRVLHMLPRAVGGHGSAQATYCLGSAGQALAASADGGLRHRVSLPGERFVHHALAVSELYVSLTELARGGNLALLDFRAEPASWIADGLGGWLKPDAFLSIASDGVADDWFVEIDLATEHLPTLKRKVETYLSFWQRGQCGPNNVMPKVVFAVPDEQRKTAIQAMLSRSFPVAPALFHGALHQATGAYLIEVLRE
jgi:Replication-relaxation